MLTLVVMSLKLAVRMMKTEPVMIKKSAGKSYLQMITSFKKNKASTT